MATAEFFKLAGMLSAALSQHHLSGFEIGKHLEREDIFIVGSLGPGMLSEVKRALESITTSKASGGDGIPVELFQILKDDAVKVLHSICQQV